MFDIWYKLTPCVKATVIIILAVILIVSIILFSVSWATLEPTEYGFDYNSVTGTVDTSYVYTGGRYFLGLGHSFITFPKTTAVLEFSTNASALGDPVQTRSYDGVALTIEFSFLYQLREDDLASVYNSFGQLYLDPLLKSAQSAVLASAGNWTAYSYWLNRSAVVASFQQAIEDTISGTYACDIVSFQLLSVSLPSQFEQSIIDTQVQEQLVIQTGYAQQVTAIQSQISNLWAQTNATNAVTLANANATSITLVNLAQVQAYNFTQYRQNEALLFLMTTLNMTTDELLAYLKARTISQKSGGKVVFGLNTNTP